MTSDRDVDQGWAWIVLAASFMNLLIGPGLAYIGGMFQNLFLEQFDQSVGLTAWVTSVFASLMQLAGKRRWAWHSSGGSTKKNNQGG